MGRDGQAFILPPCSGMGWGLPEKTDLTSKAEADLEGTDSWRLSANHIPWSRVAKSFLGEGSECCNSLSARNIFENSKQRLANHWSGILSKGFLNQVGFGIRRFHGPLSALGPSDCPLAWFDPGKPDIPLLTFIPSCTRSCFPPCTYHCMPCCVQQVELLLSFRYYSLWHRGAKSWSLRFPLLLPTPF